MTIMFRKAMLSLYRLECDISGISAARQMILRLKIKNLQCIFTGKSDRAVVHPELQPHKQWYFTYIASVLIQIYLLGKISVTCQGKIPMPNLITFSLLMLHSTTSRRTICPLITVRFKFITLNFIVNYYAMLRRTTVFANFFSYFEFFTEINH
jgi:hypothetical protein